MAFHLQSTSEIDTVQVSESIYEYVKNIKFDINIEIIKQHYYYH